MSDSQQRKLAVIVHADVAGSTALVQRDEAVAHQRILDAFRRFAEIIQRYGGIAQEVRGDALVAEFARASDAVCATLAFQVGNGKHNATLTDAIKPEVRVGISLGEVVIADGTITGAGVVLAQRLEQLAPVGGVMVQGSVAETVPTRMPFEFQNLGEQVLKGFERPVGTFLVSLMAGQSLPAPDPLPAIPGSELLRRGTIDVPSIAVLPFNNMSGDAEQEYFSDGISEDIITDLSRLSGLTVIARNSAFSYKGKSANTREIADELGARYLLQGSVRKAGGRVRVTAQLVDTQSEQQVWAERYDRDLDDIFTLQDELSREVVMATATRLSVGDSDRLSHKATLSVDAYDAVLRGREQLLRHTAQCNTAAVELFERAIALDPDYALAHGHLAETHLQKLQLGWVVSAAETLEQALRCAERAVALDPGLGLAHGVRGQINLWQGRYDDAISAGEKRVALDPGDAEGIATLAMTHAFSGTPERALELIANAMRLDPHYPFWHLHVVGLSHMAREDYAEAIAAFRRTIVRNPDSMPPHMVLAACLALVGEQVEAEKELAMSRQLHPELSISFVSEQVPYRRTEDRDRLLAGLQLAGLDH